MSGVDLVMVRSGLIAAQRNAEGALDRLNAHLASERSSYDLGFEAGVKSVGAHTPQELLSRIAGWIEAQQLSPIGPHATEAATRRRLVMLLRDLASGTRFDITALTAALEGTQTDA